MIIHLFYAVMIALFVFPFLQARMRLRIELHWNLALMSILNVNIRLTGTVPDLSVKNLMLVANHVSWLDVYLLNAMRPAQFVSKVEVRSWPIVGWLANKTGTLFIDRSKRHDTARVNNELACILSGGGCVAVFPEGTTSDGTMLRHFHASLLQPAVQSQSQLWPVAIRYAHADGTPNVAPAYVDDLSFVDSLLLILSQPVIYAEVQYLPPIDAHGKTRRELAHESHHVIACALDLSAHHHRSP
jgi:1-acyl-sn-glycerol-3-phosphate acyltransferase